MVEVDRNGPEILMQIPAVHDGQESAAQHLNPCAAPVLSKRAEEADALRNRLQDLVLKHAC